MKTRSVFEFNSYKKAMDHLLLKGATRGQLSRAAEMLKCQPSFLSRVIKSEIHLTPEHAFLLTRFWKMSSIEQAYFQTLVDFERAGESQFRSFLLQKLHELKEAHESSTKRSQKEDFSDADQRAVYFSTWIFSALHFLTTIPEFQTLKAISSRIGLTESTTLGYLRLLESMKLVRETKRGWEYAGGQFHVPKDSPFVVFHHQNWRTRSVMDAQDFKSDGIHFTSVLTLSKSDLQRLRELVIQFVSEANEISRPSEPEESAALLIDLFRI